MTLLTHGALDAAIAADVGKNISPGVGGPNTRHAGDRGTASVPRTRFKTQRQRLVRWRTSDVPAHRPQRPSDRSTTAELH